MKLITIRHGQSEMNGSGLIQGQIDSSKLTETGKLQAERAAQLLKKTEINFAYVSPLSRARETAEIILKHHPATKIIYADNLKERSFGDFEGKPSNLLMEEIRRVGQTYVNFKPNQGESWLEAGDRFRDYYLDEILPKHVSTDETILIVAHGSVLTHFLVWLDNKMQGQTDFIDFYHTHHPDNAAISIVEVNLNGEHAIQQLNDISHL